MRLYLIRHPQPEVAQGICYGSTDLPLREPWDDVLQQVRAVLPRTTQIVSSPLQRCLNFAQALGNLITVDERLRELDFGRWEMQAWEQLPRAEIDAWAADPLGYASHGGESVAALQARVEAALAAMPDETVTWVTHAGVIKIVLQALLHLPQADWLGHHPTYGSVTCLWRDASGWRLQRPA